MALRHLQPKRSYQARIVFLLSLILHSVIIGCLFTYVPPATITTAPEQNVAVSVVFQYITAPVQAEMPSASQEETKEQEAIVEAIQPIAVPIQPTIKRIKKQSIVSRQPRKQKTQKKRTVQQRIQKKQSGQKPLPGTVYKKGHATTSHTMQHRASNTQSNAGNIPSQSAQRQRYYARIRSILQRHKHYPRRARLRKQEGIVVVSFKISQSGHISSLHITQTSGYKALDKAAIQSVRHATPLPPIPASLGSNPISFKIPFDFRL